MFKSLLAKVVAITMAVILASYLFLSVVFLFFAQRYSINQSRQSLVDAVDISNRYLMVQFEYGFGVLTKLEMDHMLQNVAYANNCDIVVVINNAVYYTTTEDLIAKNEENQSFLSGNTIPTAILNQIKRNGMYEGVGDLGGVLTARRFIVAAPASLSDGRVYGYIFATYDVDSYSKMFLYLSRLLLGTILATLVVTFFATYLATRQLVKPLKEMGKAAKVYAGGNFETRIEVRGQDEVAELAVSLNEMADSLGRLEQMRRSFISSVSHDLRTPMTSISGFVDGILDGTIPPESSNYYLGIVSEETKRLSRLVRTLLDVSRLESDELTLKIGSYDICEMLRQVIVSFESKVFSKNLKLHFDICEENIYVRADNDAIYRVLYNLVDNAIKFSYEEGMLTLSVWKNEKEAIVSVRNTGYGIKKDDLPFVFDRFYKSDKSRGLDKTGVGLGLYIAKTIIEKHGGNITVRSVENDFCEFIFTLPLSEEEKRK